MRLRSTRRAGLSLIEVLVSMAVFLMALVALMYLINTSSNLASQAQHRARAAQYCRSKMNELAAGALGLEGVGETAIEDEQHYVYSIEVEPGATQALQNVTVRVRFIADEKYPIEVAMSRMVLDPAYTGSTQDVPAAPAGSTPEGQTESGTTSSSTTGSTSSGTPAASSGSSGGAAPKTSSTPATSGSAPKSGGTTAAPQTQATPKSGGAAPTMGGGSGSKGR